MARTDILDRKEEILQWIDENQTKFFISQQLNCKQETLNSYLKKMNIEYAGNQSGKGQPAAQYKTAEEYSQSTCVKSSIMRLKLLKDKVRLHKCEKCGLTEWLDKLIPLELHHKDGNHFNNNLDNLSLLCPNCHALEPGNSGAAVGTKMGM